MRRAAWGRRPHCGTTSSGLGFPQPSTTRRLGFPLPPPCDAGGRARQSAAGPCCTPCPRCARGAVPPPPPKARGARRCRCWQRPAVPVEVEARLFPVPQLCHRLPWSRVARHPSSLLQHRLPSKSTCAPCPKTERYTAHQQRGVRLPWVAGIGADGRQEQGPAAAVRALLMCVGARGGRCHAAGRCRRVARGWVRGRPRKTCERNMP
ncbi:MAG: hypothetical protein J3K34DRAFT_80729 [Monoraphidium minutum]|nr:MAG: hypothetical protein J3K34DRAFT_80729 [Monoraphidium minutum]